jgi:hypothetical protein
MARAPPEHHARLRLPRWPRSPRSRGACAPPSPGRDPAWGPALRRGGPRRSAAPPRRLARAAFALAPRRSGSSWPSSLAPRRSGLVVPGHLRTEAPWLPCSTRPALHRGGRRAAAAHSVRRRRRREHAPSAWGLRWHLGARTPGGVLPRSPASPREGASRPGPRAHALCEAPRRHAASPCRSRLLRRDLAPPGWVRIRGSARARSALASPEPWLGSGPRAGCSLRTPCRCTEVSLPGWARLHPPMRRPLPVRRARGLCLGVADFKALLRRRVRCDPHRCRWRIALSFHGLCSPPRSSFARSSRPWRLRRGCGPAPKRSATHLASGIPPAVALLRSRRTGLGLALRRSLSELGAAVPTPLAPRCPRAPVCSGARRRRPSWGL